MYRGYKRYLFLGAALFLLLSLPVVFIENLQGKTVACFSFVFKGSNSFIQGQSRENERLEGENHLLRLEINKLRALLEQKIRTEKLSRELKNPALSARRLDETQFLASQFTQAVPAKVIYRDPGSWSSSVWVNVGEETNALLNQPIIQKNSPVILGRNLVGAVDYVGKNQSRIRLITDKALQPSVRAVRGLPQNSALIDQIEFLQRQLNGRSDIAFKNDDKTILLKHLEKLREILAADADGCYLAKGIVQGGSAPLWRSVNQRLKGIGFNYDFADDEGQAQSLRGSKNLALIKECDLLVTTGMDGVFPAGLRVAEVTKIAPLREGAYAFEIEARPIQENLDTLQTVFIIPPMGYETDIEEEN